MQPSAKSGYRKIVVNEKSQGICVNLTSSWTPACVAGRSRRGTRYRGYGESGKSRGSVQNSQYLAGIVLEHHEPTQKYSWCIVVLRDHPLRLRDHPGLVQRWESVCWGVLGIPYLENKNIMYVFTFLFCVSLGYVYFKLVILHLFYFLFTFLFFNIFEHIRARVFRKLQSFRCTCLQNPLKIDTWFKAWFFEG